MNATGNEGCRQTGTFADTAREADQSLDFDVVDREETDSQYIRPELPDILCILFKRAMKIATISYKTFDKINHANGVSLFAQQRCQQNERIRSTPPFVFKIVV